MHRNPLINLLKAYNTHDQKELKNIEMMLGFINQYPNCFERSCAYGHVTGSGFLLNRSLDQVLLMQHRKLNKWLQFGGHCDGNPDVLAVAIKETQEESGITNIVTVQESIFDLDIHLIPKRDQEPEHFHFDIRFLLRVNSDEKARQNHESHALAWFCMDKNKLPTQSESLHRMFDKWAQKLSRLDFNATHNG